MLFGGPQHETYLGCISCDENAPDSIWNQFGNFGNPYSVESIFNTYGLFGSAYSIYGVCDPYATDPPVIVGSNGTAYGRLTLNQYMADLGLGARYFNWLTSMCNAE